MSIGISGNIKYSNSRNIHTNILKPNILNIKSANHEGLKLVAPVKGKMEKNIIENIASEITITLKKDNTVIFSDTSTNCGMEIVQE